MAPAHATVDSTLAKFRMPGTSCLTTCALAAVAIRPTDGEQRKRQEFSVACRTSFEGCSLPLRVSPLQILPPLRPPREPCNNPQQASVRGHRSLSMTCEWVPRKFEIASRVIRSDRVSIPISAAVATPKRAMAGRSVHGRRFAAPAGRTSPAPASILSRSSSAIRSRTFCNGRAFLAIMATPRPSGRVSLRPHSSDVSPSRDETPKLQIMVVASPRFDQPFSAVVALGGGRTWWAHFEFTRIPPKALATRGHERIAVSSTVRYRPAVRRSWR